jgi:hypothetical protein
MEYGVFTSPLLEIAITGYWSLCIYCTDDRSMMGARLYNGIPVHKTLAAICERYQDSGKTVYAYKKPDGGKQTNDGDGVCKLLGVPFDFDLSQLRKIDDIELSEPYPMPSVSEAGIERCLRQWRMGTACFFFDGGLLFQLVTDKIEYVYNIQDENCNIYCGASVNIPCDNGMLGGDQYFRLRNFADNSQPFCRFFSNLGNDPAAVEMPEIVCESGKCTQTPQGLFWPVKRTSDNEIVLDGCGGDEYVYRQDAGKSEYFNIHLNEGNQ